MMSAFGQQGPVCPQMASAIELNNQGVAALNSNDPAMAQTHFEKSLDLVKSTIECCDAVSSWKLPGKGEFDGSGKDKLFQRKDYDEGMDLCFEAVSLDVSNTSNRAALASILYNQGQCYVRLDLESEASTMFRASLEVAPACACPEACGGVQSSSILMNIGRLEYRSGSYNDAISTYTRALEITKILSTTKGDEQLLEGAAVLNCLAVLYFHLRKADTTRALANCHVALKMYRPVLGEDVNSREVATVLNNIGRIHFLREDYTAAISAYEEALSMRRILYGNGNMDVAATVFNIAQTSHALLDHDKALSFYQEFFDIASRRLGERHPDIAATKKCMAEVYHDMGRYDKALHLYKEALHIGKECLGPCDQEIAGILNKLGNLYYEQHNLEAALEAYTEELQIERACLGDCHPNLAITCTNIGQIFKRQNNYQRALAMYATSISIQRRTLTVPNVDVAATLTAIAFIYSQTKRLEEAFTLYQEVLWIQREVMGEKSIESSSTLNSIGLVLFKMEQHELALDSFYESMRIRRKAHGDHHDVAIVLYNIATVYLDLREDDQALQYYHETLRVEQCVFGDNNKEVAVVLKHIGQVNQKNGRLEEALRYYHRALEVSTKLATKGEDHLEVYNMLILIGGVHLQKGQAKEVVETCSTALRHFQLAGKDVREFQLYGFNFYSLSKMHPKCPPAA